MLYQMRKHLHACRFFTKKFVARFGLPRQLHSDQGKNFESKLFAELYQLVDINKTRTTPFHPRSDGQTERMNRTILQMLRTSSQWCWHLLSTLANAEQRHHDLRCTNPRRQVPKHLPVAGPRVVAATSVTRVDKTIVVVGSPAQTAVIVKSETPNIRSTADCWYSTAPATVSTLTSHC